MSLRTWLLAGTSITMFALAPFSAQAQDASNPNLRAAFQAYQADQSDANKQALTEACIAAGFTGLDDCIAALSGAAPVEQQQDTTPTKPPKKGGPPPSSEVPPPPAAQQQEQPAPQQDQPAPAPEASSPPAPDAAPAATPAPNGGGAAKIQAAVNDYNKAVAELAAGNKNARGRIDRDKKQIDQLCQRAGFDSTDACLAQLGLSLDPLPAAPAEAPAPAAAPSSEAAPPPPAPESQPAPAPAPTASSEAAPAPAPSPEAAPAAAPTGVTVPRGLQQAVEAYNRTAAQVAAGKKGANQDFNKAARQLEKICQNAGFSDIDACATQFGLTLAAAPNAPAETPEVTPPASSAPVEPASSVPPVSALPEASEAVTPSAVEVLPPDVSAEAAPILDSAKDQKASSNAPPASAASEQPGASSSSVPPPPPAPPAGPPPKSDQAAQADLQPPPKTEQSTQTDKGKPKPPDFTFVQPVVPTGNPDVKVVQQPKNDNGGIVFQIGINLFISNPLQDRNRVYNPDRGDKVFYEDVGFGRTRETILRSDGSKVVTIYSRNGDILKRSKILPNGREIIIASADPRDQQGQDDDWRDPGQDLPPLVLNIPAKDYVLDADNADENDVEFFLDQPPVEKVHQIYTIDDVKRSARLRDSVRRLEVGNLTFDTGKATISRDQVGDLANVANAMLKLLAKNPGEVFLIEGHTDAVGSDVANLVLSDQRAATVARILTDFYHIPPENLVTQGYGERYLKVQTDGPEPLNRRVTIKRITPLVSYDQ